jgi:hypothetical protein
MRQVSLYAHFSRNSEHTQQQDTATATSTDDKSASVSFAAGPTVAPSSGGLEDFRRPLIVLDSQASERKRSNADSDFLKFLKYSNFVSLEVVGFCQYKCIFVSMNVS